MAIGLATARAKAADVELLCLQHDLEQETLASVLGEIKKQLQQDLAAPNLGRTSAAKPPAVALVTCFHYLNRSLLASVSAGLPSGATFMASIATVKNLERHKRPSTRFLLEPGELADLIVGGQVEAPVGELSIMHSFEGWNSAGNHEAEIIVRRSRHLSD